LPKLGGNGEKFRAATGYAICILCLFSPRIGSPREIKFFCDFNWHRLLFNGASARDVSAKSGLAMTGSISMDVLVGLVECHWIWLCTSL
jgi:hypothetical protein